MITKRIVPESFSFNVPSVELVGCGSKGLDKQAMEKRASDFSDVIENIKPRKDRAYLHVITTGAMEWYGANRNADAFNESEHPYRFPFPEKPNKTEEMLDGGLLKYHDKTYMDGAAVYQEHKTKDTDPSGEIISARYNQDMHRGELIIAVDTTKWEKRLQRKASGNDIYLSMGCSVPRDLCFPAGTLVHTARGYRDIMCVAVGDLVYTAEGTLSSVTAVTARLTNYITRLNVSGLSIGIECTPNHPFLVASDNSVNYGSNPEKLWVEAARVKAGDYLTIKVEACAKDDTVGVDKAYSFVSEPCAINFKREEDKGIHVWSENEKLALLAGMLDKSGVIDPEAGDISVPVMNREDALELLQICWSVGIPASTSDGQSAGAYCMIQMCSGYEKLVKHSKRLQSLSENKFDTIRGRTAAVKLIDGYAYLEVRGTSTKDCGSVIVYNMEVDGSHTYIAEGVIVHNCTVCGRSAKTADEHCEHFKKMRCQTLDDGTQVAVINDAPKFYDISGVDVPADRIAFVLRKVADGEQVKTASVEAYRTLGARTPMLITKAARLLGKLSTIEKEVDDVVNRDIVNDDVYSTDEEAGKDFTHRVENYPSDEIIDACNRKGMLLSPGMLFRIIGKDCEDPSDRELLGSCDDSCCGDCASLMSDLEEDPESANVELLDGSFDQHFPMDLNLANIIEAFMPEFGMTSPSVGTRSIHIIIRGSTRPKQQRKTAAFNKTAQEALRKTYARYLISFAAQNNDQTCFNAMRAVAKYGK